jgi:transcriptional regulator with XRE-family HTH domain
MTRLTLRESATPRSELALFLKSLRRRIDPGTRALGAYVRPSGRVGRHVTQEEVAEAIGVSREWYATLESARRARASTRLLDRLADVLGATGDERARLFRLALPEMKQAQLREDSIVVLDAFSRLTSLIKPLWAATSIEDALVAASEQVASWFDGALLVSSSSRRQPGVWEDQAVDDMHVRNEAADVLREMKSVLPASAYDALDFYPGLPDAGDLGTPDLYPLALQRDIGNVYARYRVPGFAWLYARVRTRSGFIGGLYVAHEFGHAYSASDLAVMGTFADLTSFALS